MKLLTVAIPCYNSQDYMEKCIKSALVGGEDVEILVINDGSKDDTEKIGKKYQEKYPSIVRLINQENKGHGGAVNTGIENATGMYYKVVDSDDWLAKKPFLEVLEQLRKFADGSLDAFFCNFVYDKVGAKKKKVMQYRNIFPTDQVFSWSDVKKFPKGHYILMHSVIYRTALLRECGIKLPEHTFYVDNLYVYEPLKFVKKMYYMDVVLYRYFIGRDDQSVHESVMMGRIDQQVRVNKRMIEYAKEENIMHLQKSLSTYLVNYVEIITIISSILMIKIGTPEAFEMKTELWNYIKETDEELYKRLRYAFPGNFMNMDNKFGRGVSKIGYDIAQKVFKFN